MDILSNKIVIGALISGATLLGGGAVVTKYIPAFQELASQPEEVVIAPEDVVTPTEQVTETDEETSVEPTTETEETPVASVRIVETPQSPTTSTPKVGASANLGPHPDDGYVAPQYDFTYLGDVEQAYMGYCPQDVPKSAWGDYIQPGVALGLSSFSNGDTMKEYITHAFNSYYTGFNGEWRVMRKFDIGQVGFRYGSYPSIASWYYFEIDWDTNTVSLTHSPASQFYPSEEQLAELQAAAREGSEYLAWLKSAYKAKCGEYPTRK